MVEIQVEAFLLTVMLMLVNFISLKNVQTMTIGQSNISVHKHIKVTNTNKSTDLNSIPGKIVDWALYVKSVLVVTNFTKGRYANSINIPCGINKVRSMNADSMIIPLHMTQIDEPENSMVLVPSLNDFGLHYGVNLNEKIVRVYHGKGNHPHLSTHFGHLKPQIWNRLIMVPYTTQKLCSHFSKKRSQTCQLFNKCLLWIATFIYRFQS